MPLISSSDTIAGQFLDLIDRFRASGKDAFRRKVEGVYVGISYQELYDQVEAFALALRGLGINRGDRIGIMSENRLEWIVADFACACSGIVDVPIFPILTPKQVEYIFNNAQVRAVICSNALQLGKLMKVADNIPSLEHIVLFQEDALGKVGVGPVEKVRLFPALIEAGRKLAAAAPGQLRALAEGIGRDDLQTLIYTSGTTGNPKGVMLTQGNFAANVRGASQMFPVDESDVILSALPLCHSYERTGGYYTCFLCGATIAFAESIDTLAENLQEVRPTLLTAVPRMLERFKNRVEKSVQTQPEKRQKTFRWAIGVGVKRFRLEQRGKRPGPLLRLQNSIADNLVFAKIRERAGGRVRFFVSGGAALPQDVGEFFFAVGMRVVEGYGLTESSPIISVNPYDAPKLGTVGRPLPNVEVRLGEDGEILTRGPHVMKGYFKDPDATVEAVDHDGWLHTGDIGEFDRDGYLRITDRKKHIFVSSGGKNIAPNPIESLMLQSPYIEQIMLVGDKRPFITALIVPDLEAVKRLAQEQGSTVGSLRDPKAVEALLDSDAVVHGIDADIKRLQRDLSAFERIRRFELLAEPFTVENDMLTPTLKVKRREVEKRYKALIDAMYEGADLD